MKAAEKLAEEALKAMGGVLDDTSVPRETYRDALEIVMSDVASRIDAVNDEIESEG